MDGHQTICIIHDMAHIHGLSYLMVVHLLMATILDGRTALKSYYKSVRSHYTITRLETTIVIQNNGGNSKKKVLKETCSDGHNVVPCPTRTPIFKPTPTHYIIPSSPSSPSLHNNAKKSSIYKLEYP